MMPESDLPLPFLPVDTDSRANLLQKDAVWDCLKEIRKAGCEGVTAKEISKKTGQPQATVYGALDRLRTIGFVRWEKLTALPAELRNEIRERIESKKKVRVGKTPRVYFEPCEKRPIFRRLPGEKAENPWGDVVFSRKFTQEIGNKIENTLKEKPELKEKMISLIEKITEETLENSEFNAKRGECPVCEKDHGVLELAKGVAFYMASSLLTEDEFRKKLDDLSE